MYRISHKDIVSVVSILDSIEKILEYTSKFNNPDDLYQDTKSFDAAMMNFIIIGEMADKLSDEIKKETSDSVDWRKVVGFRNIIAHN